MPNIETKISVSGEFVYPHLTRADVRFNAEGEYKLTLKVKKSDAIEMVKVLDQALVDSLADAEKKNKGKQVKEAPKPYTVEGDNVFFKYKMKASGTNKKTNEKFVQRPALFDAKKNPIPNGTSIWGGSIGKIAYQLIPYYVPAIGAGVSARLKAVQITKLVEGSGSASSDLFKKEDGFETKPEISNGSANAKTEVQDSTDF